ncbi:hypothetical protein COO91_08855 [Nostoc flagelliforme CCNUN1]|uniref:Uncharacterized protein n=1 Tax=Nostoc flagelliforme CCNUN1 TaxID=2038116 RepID=A0A2K8T4X3_9NOSO|nr:hypothetical protein COO91_08855 [Nostoc flagelliforme CCNUN1]
MICENARCPNPRLLKVGDLIFYKLYDNTVQLSLFSPPASPASPAPPACLNR